MAFPLILHVRQAFRAIGPDAFQVFFATGSSFVPCLAVGRSLGGSYASQMYLYVAHGTLGHGPGAPTDGLGDGRSSLGGLLMLLAL